MPFRKCASAIARLASFIFQKYASVPKPTRQPSSKAKPHFVNNITINMASTPLREKASAPGADNATLVSRPRTSSSTISRPSQKSSSSKKPKRQSSSASTIRAVQGYDLRPAKTVVKY